MTPTKAIAQRQNGKLKKRILAIDDAYYKDTELFVRFLDERNLPIDYEGLKAYTRHLEDAGYAASSFNKTQVKQYVFNSLHHKGLKSVSDYKYHIWPIFWLRSLVC